MPQTLASMIGLGIVFAACLLGLLGRERERIAAVALAAAVVASSVVQKFTGRWDPVAALLAVDLLLLLVFALLSWRSARRWPVAAVALQGLISALDALKLTDARIGAYTYLTLVALISYGLAGVIAWAGWSSWRARRRLR